MRTEIINMGATKVELIEREDGTVCAIIKHAHGEAVKSFSSWEEAQLVYGF